MTFPSSPSHCPRICRRIGRRGFLRASAPFFLGGVLSPAGAPAVRAAASDSQKAGAADYAADVEFLLKELESAAGHFFEQKGIDWDEVSREFRAAVKSVRTDEDHALLCWRLLCRLKDGHARLLDLQVTLPDESNGRRMTGPGLHLVAVGDRLFVRRAFGAAAEAGLKPGMEISALDGNPAADWLSARVAELWDDHAFSTAHAASYAACHQGLADWEGTSIRLEVARGGSSSSPRRRMELTRKGGANFVPVGPAFPPQPLESVGRQSWGRSTKGFGYIHLRDVPGELPEQLDRMLPSLADAPGLILDCRANGGGGCDHAAVFARFLPAGMQWRQYAGAGTAPFAGPMVVIVDAGVRSAGETIAGQFKEDGRAFMIGDTPTAGASSQKTRLAVPSGLFTAYFSVASNKGRFNDGAGIEGIGVPPHEVVEYVPAELAEGVDTQIRRAEEILAKGIPRSVVPFAPAG